MTRLIHPIAGTLALALIAVFWLSTALSEAFGSAGAVTFVKAAIPWGLLLLIPALATAGLSGRHLAGRGRVPLVMAKQRRMPIIAANGLLILIPCAFYLAAKAGAGQFDTRFVAVQTAELVAGAVNIALLSLNMRDGLRLRRRRV